MVAVADVVGAAVVGGAVVEGAVVVLGAVVGGSVVVACGAVVGGARSIVVAKASEITLASSAPQLDRAKGNGARDRRDCIHQV